MFSVNGTFLSQIVPKGDHDASNKNEENENQSEILQNECRICLEMKTDFFHADGCEHLFCKDCLREYLKIKIDSFKISAFLCPRQGCGSIFTSKTIKVVLDQKTFSKYESMVCKRLGLSGSRQMPCPKPGCIYIHKPSENAPFTSCKCGCLICNKCGSIWHEGKTCLEAIDTEFKFFSLENKLRFCCICKTIVQKVEGCNHITCPVCDYQWCWDCGRQYTPSHRQNCSRIWDPLPPKLSKTQRLKEKILENSTVFKILLSFVLSPLLPIVSIGFLLFWAGLVCFGPKKDFSWNKSLESLFKILVVLIIGIIYSPILLLLSSIFFGFIIFIVIFALVVFYLNKISKRRPIPMENDRWMSGNPILFKYTSKGRPQNVFLPINYA